MSHKFATIALIAVVAGVITPELSYAETLEPFKGKTITLYVGTSVGSAYDIYSRILARHIGHHLPGNPTVVISNMPGANSITCANFIYNNAPKDGTAIAAVAQSIAEAQVIGLDSIRYDASRFGWIGRLAPNVEIAYVWHTVPVKTIDDLRKRETIFGANGTRGTSGILYPTLLNELADTRIKLVRGYGATPDLHLAMERGEVEGVTSSLSGLMTSSPEWLVTKKITVLLQYQFERHHEFVHVPTVMELMRTREDSELFGFFIASAKVGRSFITPPNLEPNRLDFLRQAFDETLKDPGLIADIMQSKIDLSPLSGTEVQEIIRQQLRVSPELRARILAVQWR